MIDNPVKRAIARACTDSPYRARLLNDPRKALAEEGIDVPPDVQVRIHESTDEKMIVVLPSTHQGNLSQQAALVPGGPVANVPNGLTLEWRGYALVATGRIDSNTAAAVRRELERAFTDVDLMLANVSFLSSSGLGALLAGQKHLAAHGAALRLIDVREEIVNVLDMSGLINFFELGTAPEHDPFWLSLAFHF